MLYSEEFLTANEKTRYPTGSWVGAFVSRHSDFSILVNQLNWLWSAVSIDSPRRKDIETRLRGAVNSDFWGALAELLTLYTLKVIDAGEVVYSPEKDGETPDFLLKRDGKNLYLESFIAGSDQEEESWNRDLSHLAEELKSVIAPYWMVITAWPVRNKHGNFSGAAKALKRKFDKLKASDVGHGAKLEIQFHGGSVQFELDPRTDPGPVLGGWVRSGWAKAVGVPGLINAVSKKVKKYDFEFCGACVLPGDLFKPEDIFNSMFGEPTVKPRIDPGDGYPYILGNNGNGFWGPNSPRKSNKRLLGILLIYRGFVPGTYQLSLSAQLLEHPDRHGKLQTWFPSVPDLMSLPEKERWSNCLKIEIPPE